MPGQVQESLPQITRFLAGLVTNRNPIDTPFSIVGLNIVQHHDALNDGLNMEVSATNTLIRRPGFSLVRTTPSVPRDFFFYKDLEGNPHLFYDYNGSLYIDTNTVVEGGLGGNIWSVVGVGDFVYAANGVKSIWLHNLSLNVPHSMGLNVPSVPPKIVLNTTSTALYLSDFIPSNDAIGGSLVISDVANQRTLTITIGNGTGLIHFNVTLVGLSISTNNTYTQVDTESQTGTPPNATTTDVITQTTGLTGTATGTGVSNGVVNYYPAQGTSTLDFDIGFSGNLTIQKFVTLINSMWPTLNFVVPSGMPSSAYLPLKVFVAAQYIAGQVASNNYPDTPATAMLLTTNGL